MMLYHLTKNTSTVTLRMVTLVCSILFFFLLEHPLRVSLLSHHHHHPEHSHHSLVVWGFVMIPTTEILPTRLLQLRHKHHHYHHPAMLLLPPRYMSSAPSDSASLDDESEDFSEQGYTSTTTDFDDDDNNFSTSSTTTPTGMISKLLDMLPSNSFVRNNNDNNFDKEEATRSTMNEMIVKLEKTATKSSSSSSAAFTTSPLLNGVWELRYVGGYTPTPFRISPTRQLALFLYSGGYSPGVFAYTLAQQLPNQLIDTSDRCVEITISRSQPRIEASCSVKLFNGAMDGTVKVTANLDVLSDVRFRETYESATILGQESPFSIPKPLQYSRDLYITYLDDDLLIVRDATGVPEILVRQSKQFMKDWGIEPNMVDDMVPPGDGDDANF